MKTLFLITALFLAASGAVAQEQSCDASIRTANAMMEELQNQVRLLSARAAQHYGRAQGLSVELVAVQAELAELKENAGSPKRVAE